jgi:hypothetical protein
MTTHFPQHQQRRIVNLGRSALFRIAADEGCGYSDVLDLMVTAPFTPSQPGDTSRSHATAVKTDEGACPSSLKASSSVDLSGLAAHEQGPSTELPSPGNAPEPESRSTRSRQPGSGDFLETMK